MAGLPSSEKKHVHCLVDKALEGHIADILKTRGPELTQSRWEPTISNVGKRVTQNKCLGFKMMCELQKVSGQQRSTQTKRMRQRAVRGSSS